MTTLYYLKYSKTSKNKATVGAEETKKLNFIQILKILFAFSIITSIINTLQTNHRISDEHTRISLSKNSYPLVKLKWQTFTEKGIILTISTTILSNYFRNVIDNPQGHIICLDTCLVLRYRGLYYYAT